MPIDRRLKFAMVCVSNFNRSMEAHSRLSNAGFDVESYGVGTCVKIPGRSHNQPNIFSFGTPYNIIKRSLIHRDEQLYTRTGLLELCDRNSCVKKAPQKWQDELSKSFDVVITFEKYVYDKVLDFLSARYESNMKSIIIINLNVNDSREEAINISSHIVKLCEKLEKKFKNLEDNIDEILKTFENESGKAPIYSISVL